MFGLLIIDMQNGMFTKKTPRYDSINVINHINAIAEKIRKKSGKVIFIQHDGNTDDGYIPNTKEWELIPDITKTHSDVIIHKTACDSFYHTDLEQYLRENSIERLIITGCATDYCVDTTIKAATSKDYYVIVPSDGHTTADRPSISAKQVIDHYNWIWRNLILPNKNIRIVSTNELLQEI